MLKLLLFSMLLIPNLLLAQETKYVDVGAKSLNIEGQNILAITFSNQESWHTYWKNPGDAGLAIKVNFKIDDQDIKLEDYPWPAPKRYIEQGNIWAYGYSSKYALFYKLDDNVKNKKLDITAKWLVCKDICIDEMKVFSITFNDQLKGESNTLISEKKLRQEFKKLPTLSKDSKLKFYLNKGDKENQLVLSYVIEDADFSKLSKKANLVTPYLTFPFDYKHEEIFKDEKNKVIYGKVLVDWDGIFEEPVLELPEDGVFKTPITARFLIRYPKEKTYIYEHTFQNFSLTGIKQLNKILSNLNNTTADKSSTNSFSLVQIIIFAILGGLILNLMPCVLPVISLKLFGLILHSDESNKMILKHNLFYTLGVLSSFTILASVVYVLKASGEQIGWGFQLQSPTFVLFMLLLIFLMALNMFGLFEFVTPGGKRLGNIQLKKGFSADFVNGVLATILSTPCSAPFLGSALPYAFTTSTINIYLIFLCVGIGLSLPFILTGIFPSMIKFLPKPGMWMDKLKKILALSLLLTCVWLYDVLSSLIDMGIAGIFVNSIIVLIFFAFYFKNHISKNKILRVIFFILPIILIVQLFSKSLLEVSTNKKITNQNWKSWTPKAMEQAKKSNQFSFINFTAAWCLTCKVNKKIVLESDDFKKLVSNHNINLIEGDWTKRDDNITKFLKSKKIVGVPAYFIIKPDGSVHSLGESISINKIKGYLD